MVNVIFLQIYSSPKNSGSMEKPNLQHFHRKGSNVDDLTHKSVIENTVSVTFLNV